MTLSTWPDYEVAIATGVNELTAWRNADVKLAAGEVVAPDTFKSAMITQPGPVSARSGRLNKYVQGRRTTSWTPGFVRSTHLLQTCQFGYWLKQACTTTENTPAGYDTHALTLNASQTPLNFGYHIEAVTGDNLYWDMLGICPTRRTISCSERQWTAEQVLEFQYAYLQSASDAMTPTHRAGATTGTITKNWGHFVTGGLGAGQSVFTYNSGSTECDILGFQIIEERKTRMRAYDANGFATAGLMMDHDWKVILEVDPTGDLLFTLARTAHSAYAGDMALAFSGTADATNDKITYTFNTLYMLPFDRELSYNKYTESYFITLEPYDESSTFLETGIDSLNNDHYENP